jgi:glycosyltransferase involved in cell wall biosynthesis
MSAVRLAWEHERVGEWSAHSAQSAAQDPPSDMVSRRVRGRWCLADVGRFLLMKGNGCWRDRVALGVRAAPLLGVRGPGGGSGWPGRAVRSGGGMQNHTAQLTRALAALGVRQDVITHRPPGAARHQSLAPGVEVRRFGLPVPWFRQLFSIPAALAAFRLRPQVDLVHAHQGEDLAVLPIGLAATRRAKVPVVVTLHTSLRHTLLGSGPRAQLLGGLGGSIEAAVCRQADSVIALTTRLATRLREDGIAAGRRVKTPVAFVANGREQPGLEPGPAFVRARVQRQGSRPRVVAAPGRCPSENATARPRCCLTRRARARSHQETPFVLDGSKAL